MPTCTHCAVTWTWRETIKALFTTNDFFLCPHCHTRQHQATRSKKLSSILTLLVISAPFLVTIFTNSSALIGLSLLLLDSIIFLACYPFLLKLEAD